jgi:hypothetical protein
MFNIRANVTARQTFIINKPQRQYLAPIDKKDADYSTVLPSAMLCPGFTRQILL